VNYSTQAELDAAVAYWQKILRLQDWEVKAKIVRQLDKCGDNTFKTASKKSLIRLLNPIDAVDWDFPLDHEKTLVHELLHLHLFHEVLDKSFEVGTLNDTLSEQAVECLSLALVELNRKGQ
jgi:hypothetical protein